MARNISKNEITEKERVIDSSPAWRIDKELVVGIRMNRPANTRIPYRTRSRISPRKKTVVKDRIDITPAREIFTSLHLKSENRIITGF
jgi:hypothetical protein